MPNSWGRSRRAIGGGPGRRRVRGTSPTALRTCHDPLDGRVLEAERGQHGTGAESCSFQDQRGGGARGAGARRGRRSHGGRRRGGPGLSRRSVVTSRTTARTSSSGSEAWRTRLAVGMSVSWTSSSWPRARASARAAGVGGGVAGDAEDDGGVPEAAEEVELGRVEVLWEEDDESAVMLARGGPAQEVGLVVGGRRQVGGQLRRGGRPWPRDQAFDGECVEGVGVVGPELPVGLGEGTNRADVVCDRSEHGFPGVQSSAANRVRKARSRQGPATLGEELLGRGRLGEAAEGEQGDGGDRQAGAPGRPERAPAARPRRSARRGRSPSRAGAGRRTWLPRQRGAERRRPRRRTASSSWSSASDPPPGDPDGGHLPLRVGTRDRRGHPIVLQTTSVVAETVRLLTQSATNTALPSRLARRAPSRSHVP